MDFVRPVYGSNFYAIHALADEKAVTLFEMFASLCLPQDGGLVIN